METGNEATLHVHVHPNNTCRCRFTELVNEAALAIEITQEQGNHGNWTTDVPGDVLLLAGPQFPSLSSATQPRSCVASPEPNPVPSSGRSLVSSVPVSPPPGIWHRDPRRGRSLEGGVEG